MYRITIGYLYALYRDMPNKKRGESMPASVKVELLGFIIYIYMGLVLGVIYDLYRTIRWIMRPGKIVTIIEDVVFILISILILLFSIYYVSQGEIRIYNFIGIIMGVILYYMILSKLLLKIFRKVFKVITFIIRKIIAIVSIPGKALGKIFKKIGKGIKKVSTNIKSLFIRSKKV